MSNDLQKEANPGKTGQALVDKALADLADAINAIKRTALCGLTVTNLRASASPGTIKVAHGLGYRPSGWVVTRMQGATPTTLHEITSLNPTKELWLEFVGDTNSVFDLRIY